MMEYEKRGGKDDERRNRKKGQRQAIEKVCSEEKAVSCNEEVKRRIRRGDSVVFTQQKGVKRGSIYSLFHNKYL